jgi:hypothetical protein
MEIKGWTLVTNAVMGPGDLELWDREVVPLCTALTLKATLWAKGALNGKLDDLPSVHQSYFERKNRVLLHVMEARTWLRNREVFLSRAQETPFCGREPEKQAYGDFLQGTSKYLVLHGPGGVGKTRLLLEGAIEVAKTVPLEVVFANVASLEFSSEWFAGLATNRVAVLLVDEPTDPRVLHSLIEQLNTTAMAWKMAVAVRSPKDPILAVFNDPANTGLTTFLELDGLDSGSAKTFAHHLLESGPLREKGSDFLSAASEFLTRHFSYPIYTTLAVRLLESGEDLTSFPKNAEALLRKYLEEILTNVQAHSRAEVLSVLRWIALLGVLNRELDFALDILAKEATIPSAQAVRHLISDLERKKALFSRGMFQRLVEIRPDVLADHILREWLVDDKGFGPERRVASASCHTLLETAYRNLLQPGSRQLDASTILSAVARTELSFRVAGEQIQLMQPFFKKVSDASETCDAQVARRLTDLGAHLGHLCPESLLDIYRTIRVRSTSLTNTTYELPPSLALELASPLLRMAMGAFEAATGALILDELFEVKVLECNSKTPLPRDGKRATDVFTRLLAGGPGFQLVFDNIAADLVRRQLLQLNVGEVPARASATLAFANELLETERRWSTFDAREVRWLRYSVIPGKRGWDARRLIIQTLRELSQNPDLKSDLRLEVWKSIAYAHDNLVRCALYSGHGDTMIEEAREELTWIKHGLVASSSTLPLLSAAREAWDWYLVDDGEGEFGAPLRQPLRPLAEELEKIYKAHDSANEFSELFDSGMHFEQRDKAIEKQVEHLTLMSLDEIRDFFERIVAFIKGTGGDRYGTLISICVQLGREAYSVDSPRLFLEHQVAHLDAPLDGVHMSKLALGYINEQRRQDPDKVHATVAGLISLAPSAQRRFELISELFRYYDPKQHAKAEREVVLQSVDDFTEVGHLDYFLYFLGRAFAFDLDQLKETCDQVFEALPAERLKRGIKHLVEGVAQSCWKADRATIPRELGVWLVEKTLRLDDPNDLDDTTEYHLREVVNSTETPSLSWLLQVLTARAAESEVKGPHFRFLGYKGGVAAWVKPVAPDQAADETTRTILQRLLELAQSAAGPFLTEEMMARLDPEGHVLPSLIADHIKKTARLDYAGFARNYEIGSPAWRTIAHPALIVSHTLSTQDRNKLYKTLSEKMTLSWSANLGEVPSLFVDNVKRARRLHEHERDPDFLGFCNWYLKVAEERLQMEIEEAKEERGE